MSARSLQAGAGAVATKGWVGAHKWLLLRRAAQVFWLALFLMGPWAGIWIVKGNLASSRTLDVLSLTDPYVLLQSLAARHWPELTAITGALIVTTAYVLVGGRSYCSWVCPLNPVTDFAHWLRLQLGIEGGLSLNRNVRLWLLGATFVAALSTGTIAWEAVNPVSLTQREIIFGTLFTFGSLGSLAVLAVFLFDFGVANRGWCGHVCPVGGFYGLLGGASVVRVGAVNRAACNDCMDCYAVCPEPQVITPALKGEARGIGPVILARDCTNCGRCIDVCTKDVYAFTTRFRSAPPAPDSAPAPLRP